MRPAFDLAGPLPLPGHTVIEASAGTGKTYSLTGLIVRAVAEQGVTVDSCLVVTFTRAAAAELRERTRAALGRAAAVLTGVADADEPWLVQLASCAPTERAARAGRVTEALQRFDDVTVTTIHGFCQLALAQLGLRGGAETGAVLADNTRELVAEVCRDVIVSALADDPHALDSLDRGRPLVTQPSQAESQLANSVHALLTNPSATLVPRPLLAAGDESPVATQAARGRTTTPAQLTARGETWRALTARAVDMVEQRRRARREFGYDTLVSALRDAIADPSTGRAVAEQLAGRYSLVLVDEFQDTDATQWQIFSTAFASSTLVTVGDPKQAIYRFRGADVHAYLEAVQPSRVASALTVNHRSDAAVLAGLDTLLCGATLGHDDIAFAAVTPRPTAPIRALTGIDGPAGVRVRVVPPDPSLLTVRGNEQSMPLVRTLVLDDLVARTIDLLDNGVIASGQAPLDPPSTGDEAAVSRRVGPGDIAVLVNSHADAANVADALRRARIPAVRTRTGSVLSTAAADQWRLLLAALAQPHRPPLVRAAALGWFLATPPDALVEDERVLVSLHEHVARLADRLRQRGVSAFYDEQKSPRSEYIWRESVLLTMLARDGGERDLTDLDHVAEMLAAELHGQSSEPAHVLRVLEHMIATRDNLDDDAMRRIDSDAQAVQITTVHGAKGLEFPIVLIPFAFKARANASSPYSYVGVDGTRTIDVASMVRWDGGPIEVEQADGVVELNDRAELRREWTQRQIEGDELRLLYVALTRAIHHVELWWASTQRSMTSALARVLFDRDHAGPLHNTPTLAAPNISEKTGKRGVRMTFTEPPFRRLSIEAAASAAIAFSAASGGTVDAELIVPAAEPQTWGGRTAATEPSLGLAPTPAAPIAEPAWRRWSFSAIGAAIESGDNDHVAGAEDVAGGQDEPAQPADELTVDATDPASLSDADSSGAILLGPATQVTTGQSQLFDPDTWVDGLAPPVVPALVMPWADVPGGTRFGTFAHAVLESLDPTRPDLASELPAAIALQARRNGYDLPPQSPTADIAAGFMAAVHTPLGPLFDQRSLSEFAPHDRLAELDFDFPIRAAASAAPLRAAGIGQVLLATLAESDPMRPFADQLVTDLADIDIAGWMHGSIDAVFRVRDPHVPRGARYVVVDYKTNKLHSSDAIDPLGAYRPALLVDAMEHSRYPLQAVIYTVALHRYLRWRLGDAYDPSRHLGGVGYLFLRGMVGVATPSVDGVRHGVCSWQPGADAIVALDHYFATGQGQ